MSKQSVGIYNRNYKNRFDNNVKVLVHPANPDVVTETFLLGLDHHITGENCVMVFMPFPYTEEDSFVMKREFIERGAFRMFKYTVIKANLEHYGSSIETLEKPAVESEWNQRRY